MGIKREPVTQVCISCDRCGFVENFAETNDNDRPVGEWYVVRANQYRTPLDEVRQLCSSCWTVIKGVGMGGTSWWDYPVKPLKKAL